MKQLNKDINETGVLLKQLATSAANPSERHRLKLMAQSYSSVLDRIERLDKQLIAESNQRLKVIHEAEVQASNVEEEESLIQAQ